RWLVEIEFDIVNRFSGAWYRRRTFDLPFLDQFQPQQSANPGQEIPVNGVSHQFNERIYQKEQKDYAIFYRHYFFSFFDPRLTKETPIDFSVFKFISQGLIQFYHFLSVNLWRNPFQVL